MRRLALVAAVFLSAGVGSGCSAVSKILDTTIWRPSAEAPVPMPLNEETKEGWLVRCMGDEGLVAEFTDRDRRSLVCEQRWVMRPVQSNLGTELAAGITEALVGTAAVGGEVIDSPMGGTTAAILALLAAKNLNEKRKSRKKPKET